MGFRMIKAGSFAPFLYEDYGQDLVALTLSFGLVMRVSELLISRMRFFFRVGFFG